MLYNISLVWRQYTIIIYKLKVERIILYFNFHTKDHFLWGKMALSELKDYSPENLFLTSSQETEKERIEDKCLTLKQLTSF